MSFVLIKVGNRGFTPVQVSFGRMLFGLLALLPVCSRSAVACRATGAHGATSSSRRCSSTARRSRSSRSASSTSRRCSRASGTGRRRSSCSLVVLLTLPEERPTRERALGLALGFAGVLVVLGAWRGIGGGELAGSAACLAAAILYGIGFPYIRRNLATGTLSVPVLAFGQLAMGTLQLALVLPFAGGIPTAFSPGPLAAVAALGAVGTGAAYLLNYSIIRAPGATAASTVTYLVPVFATIAGVAFLSEQPDLERAARRTARPARRRREPGTPTAAPALAENRRGLTRILALRARSGNS